MEGWELVRMPGPEMIRMRKIWWNCSEGRSCRNLGLWFFVFVSGPLAAKLRTYYSWSVRSEITPDSVQEMPGIVLLRAR